MITAQDYIVLKKVVLPQAVKMVSDLSRSEPHKMFWIVALRCPGCRRHIVGFTVFDSGRSPNRPLKYVVATVHDGVVIGRTQMRRH
jgi:hypothetical protein